MKPPKLQLPFINRFFKFQKTVAKRIVWPYPDEEDSLFFWQAFILSAILTASLLFGLFALFSAVLLIIKENAWGLAIVDSLGFILCLLFLFVHRIRFEIRAGITLLMIYVIGTGVILSVGLLSGGPAWLFAFAVLSGVLMGNVAAFAAIVLNALCLIIVGTLMATGKFGAQFPFFTSSQAMIAAGVNFIVLNAITAVSVSALLKGVFKLYTKKDDLARRLEDEKLQMTKTRLSLEKEIQDRKKTEKALQESESLFKLITEHTSALVSIHDANADYIFASPSHKQLGINPEELIGRSGLTMIIKEDINLLLEHLENARKGKISTALLNFRIKDKKGRIHYFRGSFDAVFKPDGSLERIVGVAEDETELRLAHAAKINAIATAAEAKKLALIGQVAGKMAHDFNNILGIIMGVSELSIMECTDGNISKSLELILNQTIRGKNLTKNLVAFAKSQEPKQEFFKISEKIDLVLTLMEKDLESIELTVEHESDIPDLLADPGMVEHALVNFLQNAIHATSRTDHPKITIRTYCRDKNICFDIKDNGCGIPKEHLKDIYEPSFTLKGSRDAAGAYEPDIKGTGYGLANAKKYTDQHNGNIFVESIINSGSKFTVCLPVIEKQLSQEEKTELQSEIRHFGKKVLLVEDEPAISDVQFRILTQHPCNHKVDIAGSGRAAMDLFDRGRYDLVSLDYILPGRINGMDVYNHIRQKDKTIPILFVSGNIDFLESIQKMKQQDKNLDNQSKPCLNKEYIKSINKLLETNFAAKPTLPAS